MADENDTQFSALASEAKTNPNPIHMINMIRFHDQAEYPAELAPSDGPLTGEQAYGRYGEMTQPLLNGVGGGIVAFSVTNHVMIGPADQRWDQVFTVKYPSRAAFLEMVTSPEYQAILHHRTAAVADSRLILTEDLSTR